MKRCITCKGKGKKGCFPFNKKCKNCSGLGFDPPPMPSNILFYNSLLFRMDTDDPNRKIIEQAIHRDRECFNK